MKIAKPDRVRRETSFELAAPAELVFPLFCPVRERDWVPGWDPIVVFSESGLVERDCVFVTAEGEKSAAKAGKAVWIFTEHDADLRRLTLVCVAGQRVVKRLDLSVAAIDARRSQVFVRYTLTALDAEGLAELGRFDVEAFTLMMAGWRAAIDELLQQRAPAPAASLSQTPADVLVEIKALFAPSEDRRVRELLGLTGLRRARAVTFFDTEDRALMTRGVILRFRQTQTASGGLRSISTVKLRPREVMTVPAKWRSTLGFKGDIDRVGEDVFPSVVLSVEQTGKRVRDWVEGSLSAKDYFDAQQLRFIAELTDAPVELAPLRPYGPVDASVWRGLVPAFGCEVTLERWRLGDEQVFFELSFRASLGDADAAVERLDRWIEANGVTRAAAQTKTRAALDYFAARRARRSAK